MAKEIINLRDAVNGAKSGLSIAVRSLIHNGIHDGSEERNRLENAFEEAKNALATEVRLEHLTNAVANLKVAVNILSNHSLKNMNDLAVVKETLAASETNLTRLQLPAA